MNRPIEISLFRNFSFPAEQVFDAWLDAKALGKWFFATPDGQMQTVEMDPVVGGSFLFAELRPGGLVEHVGQYLVINRPGRLVFEFSVRPNQSSFIIEISIESLPTGCRLALTTSIPQEFSEYAARSRQGWENILAGLEKSLEKKL